QEKTQDAFVIRARDEAVIVECHGGYYARSAVGGRGHYAAACGILFIHRHGISRNPVKCGQRITAQPARFLLAQPLSQPVRTSPDVQSAWQNTFRRNAALYASLRHLPNLLYALPYDLNRRQS